MVHILLATSNPLQDNLHPYFPIFDMFPSINLSFLTIIYLNILAILGKISWGIILG